MNYSERIEKYVVMLRKGDYLNLAKLDLSTQEKLAAQAVVIGGLLNDLEDLTSFVSTLSQELTELKNQKKR